MADNWPFVGAYSSYLKIGLISLTALFGVLGVTTPKDKPRLQRILLLSGISITFIFSLAISVSDIRIGQIAARKYNADLKRILRPISQQPRVEVEFRLAPRFPRRLSIRQSDAEHLSSKSEAIPEREPQLRLDATKMTFGIQIPGIGEKTPLRHLLPKAQSVPLDFNDTNDLDLYFQHQREGVSCKTLTEITDKPDLILISKEHSGNPSIDLDPTVSWNYDTSPGGESIDLRRTVTLQILSTDGKITSVEMFLEARLWLHTCGPRRLVLNPFTLLSRTAPVFSRRISKASHRPSAMLLYVLLSQPKALFSEVAATESSRFKEQRRDGAKASKGGPDERTTIASALVRISNFVW